MLSFALTHPSLFTRCLFSTPPPGHILVWRADLIHCGGAYSDFNAHDAFQHMAQPITLPVEFRRKADKEGQTQTFVFRKGLVESWGREVQAIVTSSDSSKRKCPTSRKEWAVLPTT